MNSIKKITYLSACALALFTAQAKADDISVTAPRVDKGEMSVEAKLNYDVDNNAAQDQYFSQVYGLEYGVTDYWATELAGELEKDPGADSSRLTNIKWENLIVPFKRGENWADIGVELEVEKAAQSGDPNNIEAKFLVEKDVGNFENIANLKINREFGPNAATGIGRGLALHTSYRLDEKFEPGLEYHADFGQSSDNLSFNEQDHKFGPVVKGKIASVKYDTGILFGVSDAAADTTAKLNLEYEF
ncbi:MAG: hypothetical protein KGQ41_01760 [Alphaproteobacteria bacterium]|nr:hypothetical protein [Alphaproteobacteria bacterium]